MKKAIHAEIQAEGLNWYVEGVYWPPYRAPRENGLPIEADEPACVEIENVFLVEGMKHVLIPLQVLHGDFLEDLEMKVIEKCSETY